jgi:hypothetical protein
MRFSSDYSLALSKACLGGTRSDAALGWKKDPEFVITVTKEPATLMVTMFEARREATMPDLTISPEKVAYIIEKAREYDVKEANSDPDSGSNPTDDDMIDVLEDDGQDPVGRELASFIRALNEDEQVDLVALMWLGRGEGTIEEWDDLRARALEVRGGYRNARRETVHYLLGDPMLGDFLADGLEEFGHTDESPTPDSSSSLERDEDETARR